MDAGAEVTKEMLDATDTAQLFPMQSQFADEDAEEGDEETPQGTADGSADAAAVNQTSGEEATQVVE